MPGDKAIENIDLKFDRNHIWHPYTSMIDPLPVYPILSANGVRLKLENGKELIDGMSSWWTAIHGYNVQELNMAAEEQLSKMSHVMFGGITHEPAIELVKRLVKITPGGLDKVFFADSGSVSVEVAMKMAIQYQQALGKGHKKKFLTFKKGYHGDTAGAMSVCDPESGMHHLFADFMPQHYFADEPLNGFDRKLSDEEVSRLERFFSDHAQESAAFILEPIVQGAGGMRIYSPEYLKIIRELCNQHGLLFIADEIATGFGRTGKMFAVEHAQIVPDIMSVGKALTGGYLTLAATLCTENVAITISQGEAGVLMHGPTFMGNPLACAIACKSIDLLLNSPWRERVMTIEKILRDELMQLADHPKVKDVRVLGGIGVVETVEPIDVAKAQAFFVENGVWIRPFRNLIYVMPPFVIGGEDLHELCQIIKQSFEIQDVL